MFISAGVFLDHRPFGPQGHRLYVLLGVSLKRIVGPLLIRAYTDTGQDSCTSAPTGANVYMFSYPYQDKRMNVDSAVQVQLTPVLPDERLSSFIQRSMGSITHELGCNIFHLVWHFCSKIFSTIIHLMCQQHQRT